MEKKCDGHRLIEPYMLGHARIFAALDLGWFDLIEEDTPGKLIRVERSEVIDILESSPVQLSAQSKSRLEEDGLIHAARLFVAGYDYVWAIFSPSEEFKIKDIFVRVNGPGLEDELKPAGVYEDADGAACVGCNTESAAPCFSCSASLPAPEVLDYKPIIDISFGTLQELTIPKIPQSVLSVHS